MADINEARFLINGTPSEDASGDRGFVATSGQLLTLLAEKSPSGALAFRYQVFDPADLNSPLASLASPNITFDDNSLPAITETPATPVLITLPVVALAVSWVIRCTASTPTGQDVFERLVAIRTGVTTPPLRKTVPAETQQFRARSFSDDLNEIVDAIAAGGGGGGAAFRLPFTDASLAAGVLTISHNLGVSFHAFQIFDQNGEAVTSDLATDVDANTMTIDLTSLQDAYGGTIPGTWNAVVGF
jgi:hypothetical protein